MASRRQSRSGTGNPRNGPECHFHVEGSQVDSVWDAKTQEKAIEVEGPTYVGAVDISPDSTRFATGTGWTSFKKGSIAIRNILTEYTARESPVSITIASSSDFSALYQSLARTAGTYRSSLTTSSQMVQASRLRNVKKKRVPVELC